MPHVPGTANANASTMNSSFSAAASAALQLDLPADPRDPQIQAYLNLKLREIGQPGVTLPTDGGLSGLVGNFIALSREKDRALVRHLCPVDQRI